MFANHLQTVKELNRYAKRGLRVPEKQTKQNRAKINSIWVNVDYKCAATISCGANATANNRVRIENLRGCWRYEKKSLILRLTRPKETALFVALR